MKKEVKLLRDFEVNIGNLYDKVMFVAKREADQFDKILGEKKSIVVPLGVDYDFLSHNLALEKKAKSIAFMGALNVAHNENGITYFIEKCMPEILKKEPTAKLYIIGGGASEALKRYGCSHIVFEGRVTDIRRAIGECEVFICPLQFGSGIKTKNLEAMAIGVPVVTTETGAENIDAKNGVDWLVAENDEQFISYVCAILANSKLRSTIGANGQEFVRRNFTWNNAKQVLGEILRISYAYKANLN